MRGANITPYFEYISYNLPRTLCQALEMDKKEDSGVSVVRDPSQKSDGEKQTEQTLKSPEQGDTAEYEFVTGFKLAMVIVSVTMVAFILMLDTSIIATVSQ